MVQASTLPRYAHASGGKQRTCTFGRPRVNWRTVVCHAALASTAKTFEKVFAQIAVEYPAPNSKIVSFKGASPSIARISRSVICAIFRIVVADFRLFQTSSRSPKRFTFTTVSNWALRKGTVSKLLCGIGRDCAQLPTIRLTIGLSQNWVYRRDDHRCRTAQEALGAAGLEADLHRCQANGSLICRSTSECRSAHWRSEGSTQKSSWPLAPARGAVHSNSCSSSFTSTPRFLGPPRAEPTFTTNLARELPDGQSFRVSPQLAAGCIIKAMGSIRPNRRLPGQPSEGTRRSTHDR